tara:strand:- start:94 stop:687 length:594 start_codon:yes stop_codon:yes gene_type:complete
MKVLVACEFSGTVRDCFIAMGHDAISCDLLPTEARGPHIQGDILDILYDRSWDLIIAHPPCTYLSASGLHWNKKIEGRAEKTDEALDFITAIWEAPVKKLCIENPVGCINTRLDFMPKPQYVQPYNYDEDASKKTGLWLRGLAPLEPTGYIEPRIVDGKPRWSNQSDTGYDKFGGGQGKERSVTFFGIAAAMAMQWG